MHAKCHIQGGEPRYRILARPTVAGVTVLGVATGTAVSDGRGYLVLAQAGTEYLVNMTTTGANLSRVIPAGFTLLYPDGALRDVRLFADTQYNNPTAPLVPISGPACGFTQISHELVSR